MECAGGRSGGGRHWSGWSLKSLQGINKLIAQVAKQRRHGYASVECYGGAVRKSTGCYGTQKHGVLWFLQALSAMALKVLGAMVYPHMAQHVFHHCQSLEEDRVVSPLNHLQSPNPNRAHAIAWNAVQIGTLPLGSSGAWHGCPPTWRGGPAY